MDSEIPASQSRTDSLSSHDSWHIASSESTSSFEMITSSESEEEVIVDVVAEEKVPESLPLEFWLFESGNSSGSEEEVIADVVAEEKVPESLPLEDQASAVESTTRVEEHVQHNLPDTSTSMNMPPSTSFLADSLNALAEVQGNVPDDNQEPSTSSVEELPADISNASEQVQSTSLPVSHDNHVTESIDVPDNYSSASQSNSIKNERSIRSSRDNIIFEVKCTASESSQLLDAYHKVLNTKIEECIRLLNQSINEARLPRHTPMLTLNSVRLQVAMAANADQIESGSSLSQTNSNEIAESNSTSLQLDPSSSSSVYINPLMAPPSLQYEMSHFSASDYSDDLDAIMRGSDEEDDVSDVISRVSCEPSNPDSQRFSFVKIGRDIDRFFRRCIPLSRTRTGRVNCLRSNSSCFNWINGSRLRSCYQGLLRRL